ncbi:MAG: glycosyltransferase family 2 protein [Legionellaceae bacterium]|nr:glycosyltransferase family 2 protein [Legionellaceae bacterium]
MNESGLVSVIIPTYNRADWLKIAIESVLTQTYKHLELLILDNCSSDHTPEVVAGFNDPRIKYLRHQCNIESSANWTYGVYWAQGEYLSILGDDDFYKPDFLASRLGAFDRFKKVQAVFSNYETCDDRGRLLSTSIRSFDSETVMNGKELLTCIVTHTWFIGATLFRRGIVLTHWDHSTRAGHATDTSLKVRIALDPTNDVAWIHNDGLVVRQHQSQECNVRGKHVLFGYVAAFHEPLMFGNHTWGYRRLLKRGAAWAYDIIGRSSWDSGDIRVARQCFLRQLSAFPFNIMIWSRLLRCYFPWLYPVSPLLI